MGGGWALGGWIMDEGSLGISGDGWWMERKEGGRGLCI